jgi:hypothetical protein
MNGLTQLGKKAKKVWSAYISTAWSSTLDKLLLLLVAGCLVVLLAHDLGPRLVDWSELFLGGAELWNLLYELSLASPAAYVFYFLVVHLKRQRDREILKPFLYLHTNSIVEDAKFISRKLAGASDNDLKGDFPPTPGVTRGMCRSVNPRSQVPGLLPLRWFELLETRRRLTKESSANIYTARPSLKPNTSN